MLTAAIASKDAASSGSLHMCLQETGLVRSVREWTVSCERHPGPGESVPEVVLLDLSGDTESCFAFAAHLRRLRPTVRIIACSPSQHPDPAMLLQAMRSGVQEFLPKPINPTVLQETLVRFIRERGVVMTGRTGKLIVVMGSKGGVGTSTVAVNLGVQLAQLTQERVVLLDFARPVGHVCLLLDLQPRFSVRDATENLDRLDDHFFGGLLSRHKSGLDVLAGTSHPDEWEQIPVPALMRLTNVAQSLSGFVLMDYGSAYSSQWGPLLRQAHSILLVAEANVPALWTLGRYLSATAALGLSPERIRLVINRWHPEDEEALKSVGKNLKCPIFARLPNDFRRMSGALNLGVPLSGNHNNRIVSKFRQMAGQVAGIPSTARRNKNAGSSLFSFLGAGRQNR